MFRWLFPKIKYYYVTYIRQDKKGSIIIGSSYCQHENEFNIISVRSDFPNEVVKIINVVEISKKQWEVLVEKRWEVLVEGVNK